MRCRSGRFSPSWVQHPPAPSMPPTTRASSLVRVTEAAWRRSAQLNDCSVCLAFRADKVRTQGVSEDLFCAIGTDDEGSSLTRALGRRVRRALCHGPREHRRCGRRMICSGLCRRRFMSWSPPFSPSWGTDSYNGWISSRGPGHRCDARLRRLRRCAQRAETGKPRLCRCYHCLNLPDTGLPNLAASHPWPMSYKSQTQIAVAADSMPPIEADIGLITVGIGANEVDGCGTASIRSPVFDLWRRRLRPM